MKRRLQITTPKFLAVVLSIVLFATSTGCAAILEGEDYVETLHSIAPYEPPPEEWIQVNNYDELVAELFKLIMQHEESGSLKASNFSGDITENMNMACTEIMSHPIGAYAVADIKSDVKRIVSVYEIGISISYKRTKQQIDSLVEVKTLQYLRTELLNAMSEYRLEAVFRTSLNITEEDVAGIVKSIYYQNPRRIVMLPAVVVEIYPESGDDRIYALTFANPEQPGILQQYGMNLATRYVRDNAKKADGNTEADLLLSLAENLIASTGYDEGTAKAISVHGPQNFAATAYGALVYGNAVGEGFAMAFKALCDELGLDCRVVLGYLDGMVHAWNIIYLDYYYYHIDIAMCAVNGIETAFLMTDADIEEHYSWEREVTVSCRGPLTYEELFGTVEDAEPGEEGDDTEENGEGGGTGPDSESPGVTPGGTGEQNQNEKPGVSPGKQPDETGPVSPPETPDSTDNEGGNTTETPAEQGEEQGETPGQTGEEAGSP